MKIRKLMLIVFSLTLLCLLVLGFTYSLWFNNGEQNANNLTNLECFDISYTENNASLVVSGDYPKSNKDGLDRASYSFTLENVCDSGAYYEVNLNLLSDNSLDDEYINVAINNQIFTLDKIFDKKSNLYSLVDGYLDSGDSKDFEFKQWPNELGTLETNDGKIISSKISITSVPSEVPYREDLLAGSDPIINKGFVPVTIGNNGDVVIADIYEEWYNYEDKEWANAVTLKNDRYLYESPGTIIPMKEIDNMFVWVPRYAYDYESIIDADHAIDITFVDTMESAHNGFSVEESQITGFWTGKFELASEDYNGSSELVTKPSLIAKSNYSISSFFSNALNMNYMNNLDKQTEIHLIKNLEWGAIAYLSQSIFGVCSSVDECLKVENNNHYNGSANDIVTGCGGGDSSVSISASDLSICPEANRWNTESGMSASTTRNITGIYDMAGGKREYVMGITMDQNKEFIYSSSGFNAVPASKYYDSYLDSLYNTNFTCCLDGDAICELTDFEISRNSLNFEKWNDDFISTLSSYSNGAYAYMIRGGTVSDFTSGGIFFSGGVYGGADSQISSRITAWSY